MITRILFISLVLFFSKNVFSQERTVLYKQVDTTRLYMKVLFPEGYQKSEKYPAIVFYYGGGWKSGNISQFLPQATYFSKKGFVCFLVQYRTFSQYKTTPFESVKDAKSSMRFIKARGNDFSIDTARITASGGSAGGHLAASLALINGYNEDSDDLKISPRPAALVLYNPVIDNGPGGYGFERIGEAYHQFSPLHNIKTGAPPTLFMLGTEDKLIPVVTAQYYKMVMGKVGSKCNLVLYDKAGHGFFNNCQNEFYAQTLQEFENFLTSLGYLKNDSK